MKKNKVLYRCYFGGYILWLFGALLAPLLSVKINTGFALTMLILACLTLAGLITSHVFYNKKREWFIPSAYIAHGVNFALIAFAFIVEMTLVGQGQMGLYAVIIASASFGFYILDYIYLVFSLRHLAKKMKEEKRAMEEEMKRQQELSKE